MQTSSQVAAADATPEQEEAEALAVLGPAVLTNGLIFAALWANLGDRVDKRSLRRVCRGVRALADSSVAVLDVVGKGSTQMATALMTWHGVTSLKAAATAATFDVLSVTSLPRLRKLTLRHTGEQGTPPARSVAVERAGELATMDLWDALASFAEGGGMPRGAMETSSQVTAQAAQATAQAAQAAAAQATAQAVQDQ
ncbi:hypothetical protein FOA52_007940 [Chlamydomonas sp. UWO 241]|nr:hypothetical protein FOA52_007940 [Chlamydomonas sp. UWO 241]